MPPRKNSFSQALIRPGVERATATRHNALIRTSSGDGKTFEMEPRVLSGEDSLHVTLRDLVSPLFRRWRVLLSTFLCVFAVVAWAGFLRLHRYEARMSILVRRERPDPVLTAGGKNQPEIPVSEEEVKSLAALFKSRDLLEKVVIANGLEEVHGGFLHPRQTQTDSVARAVRTLATEIEIEIPYKSNLIEVSYSSPDPALTYSVLNSLSSFYIAKHAGIYPASGSQAQNQQAAREDAEAGLRTPSKMSPKVSPDRPSRSGPQIAKTDNSMLNESALQGEAKAEEREYLLYLSQREQEHTLLGNGAMTAVSLAVPPAIPVLPAHTAGSILLLAFILAWVATCLAGYVMHCFDPFFHTPAEVSDVLGIPVVEAVPKRTA